MITKQQKFIEDNDIVGTQQDKSKLIETRTNLFCNLDMDLFLDEANDIDEGENDEHEAET